MDLEKFAPENLANLTAQDYELLNLETVSALADLYPNMKSDLLIAKKGTLKPRSMANYKSLRSLLASGHKFVVVGTAVDLQKKATATTEAVQVERLVPETPIFLDAIADQEESEDLTVPAPDFGDLEPEIANNSTNPNPVNNVVRKSAPKSRTGRNRNSKSSK